MECEGPESQFYNPRVTKTDLPRVDMGCIPEGDDPKIPGFNNALHTTLPPGVVTVSGGEEADVHLERSFHLW